MTFWSKENVPWMNMHDLNLDWIINTMKEAVEQWIVYRTVMDAWKDETIDAFNDLQDYVHDYFANLDISEEVWDVINNMIENGSFITVLLPSITNVTGEWLSEHITPTQPAIDNTLTVNNAAANSKSVGNAFVNIIANVYNNTSTYSAGDYCLLNNILYRCKVNIDTAENWNAAHWDIVQVSTLIKNLSKSAFNYISIAGTNYNELTNNDDCSIIYRQGCYRKLAAVSVLHWPPELADQISFLLVFASNSGGAGLQLCGNASGILYMRYNSTTTHGVWYKIASNNDVLALETSLRNDISNKIGYEGFIPASSNVNGSFKQGTYQKGTASTDLTNWPDNLTGTWAFLNFKTLDTAAVQFFGNLTELYYRYAGGTIGKLHKIDFEETYVIDKNGSGDYTSVIACFKALSGNKRKKTIFIMGGEYDIYQDYLNNNVPVPPAGTNSSNYKAYNIYVPYNTKVIGLGNVIFKWAPNNGILTTEELEIWSPVNIRGNVHIENIKVIGKNCRYLIHDDTHNEYTKNKHIYKNVYLERTEKGDSSGSSFNSLFGSAWADKCEYVFDNVVFINKSTTGYCIWSHDAPQETGETRNTYSGASIDFLNCVFSTFSTLNDVVLGGGVNNILQYVTFTRCINLLKIWLRKSNENSIQPYILKCFGSGNPTITIDDPNNTHIPEIIQ